LDSAIPLAYTLYYAVRLSLSATFSVNAARIRTVLPARAALTDSAMHEQEDRPTIQIFAVSKCPKIDILLQQIAESCLAHASLSKFSGGSRTCIRAEQGRAPSKNFSPSQNFFLILNLILSNSSHSKRHFAVYLLYKQNTAFGHQRGHDPRHLDPLL